MSLEHDDIAKEREKKIKFQKNIISIFMFMGFTLCGFLGGLLFGDFIKKISPEGDVSGLSAILGGVAILIVICLCAMLHIYLHECGHLLFGLLTGYSFQSIRFGSLIICKTGDKVKIAKYSLAGTGGQCLMTPPDVDEEEMPTSLYNWGGIIVNGVLVIIFCVTFLLFPDNALLHMISAIVVIVGIIFIVINGIPLEALGNDGYNAIHLQRDLRAKHAFKMQLLVVNELTKNHSITDMPSEWFEWEYNEHDCAMAMSGGVIRLNRLVSTKRIEEAYALSEFLIKHAFSLVEIHQIIVYAENLCCKIWLKKDAEEIKRDFEKHRKSFMALKQDPSIQRMLFLYYKMIEKDEEKAKKAKSAFEKTALRYPYPCEIDVERELMIMELPQFT